ncbi:monocarboxylate transporter 12-B-like [Pollicipes pollicipes]|uniref:monocarboxylate transporter 12-B-like n=1 Tax=Pollicipes pollicipes TaxID=41117 RepID=UPI0018852194|nr:monocarboxylate transporter 12-B-like [Pollicipes pollicipes]
MAVEEVQHVEIDGGYGWVVAFGAFLANFCIAGTIKSYGLLNLMVIETFAISAAQAAVVPGLLLTISLLISPVVGALCERFTCRKVVTAGGIFCFLGFALGSLATSITHLCLTVGVLAGIGTGCATTPGILITTRYFPTRRSMVNGLVLAGNAAGGFALPPLFQYLLAELGVRGTLLVIAALCLHVVAGAALSRPIAVHEAILRRRRRRRLGAVLAEVASEFGSGLGKRPPSELRRASLRPGTHMVPVVRPGPDGQPTRLLMQVPARLRTSSLMLSTTDVTTDATSQFNDDIRRLREAEGSCAPHLYRRVRRYLDLDLLKNPLFLLVALSVFFMAAGAPYALLQMPVFGVSRGLTRAQTAEILSIVSAVDLASRLCFGWLFDQNLFRRQHAFAISQLLGGVSVLALPFVQSYAAILALFIVYSVGIGTWFVNLAPVLADHHGIDRIASTYGLVRMFHGLSTLAMPPVFGVIVDRTGDYGSQFFAIGSSMILGGVLVLVVGVTRLEKEYGTLETPPEQQPDCDE